MKISPFGLALLLLSAACGCPAAQRASMSESVLAQPLPKSAAVERRRLDAAAAGQLAALSRAASSKSRRGVCAVLSGGSSADRTLAAQVAAEDAGTQLYRVDLSRVVSKYIGETEKNLNQLFERASQVQWTLLFDEADELFGKRSEVRDSHDRYANLDVASLLQRIERYPGLVLLSSNLPARIDARVARQCPPIRATAAP
jgi:hypothetical protein